MAKFSVNRALLKATFYVKRGEFEKAHEMYAEILDAFPNNMRARNGLAALNILTARDPDENPPKHLMQQLIQLYDDGQLNEAVEYGKALTEAYPKSLIAWNVLGASFGALGHYDEAKSALLEIINIDEHSVDAYNNLGKVLLEQKEFDEAETYYRKALLLQSSFSPALHGLGTVLIKTGRVREALDSFFQAIESDNNNLDAHRSFHKSLIQLSGPQAALYKILYKTTIQNDTAIRDDLLVTILKAIDAYKACDYFECHALLERYHTILQGEIKYPLHQKDAHFCHAYHGFLSALLEDQPCIQKADCPNIYHIGDSHCLSFSGSRCILDGIEQQVVSLPILGAKAYHFNNSKDSSYRSYLKNYMDDIPARSTVLLSFGEIDCRIDEGFIIASAARNIPIDKLISETVTGFVNWIINNTDIQDKKLFFINVPAPVLNNNLSKKQNEEVKNTVQLYNDALAKIAQKEKVSVIDVFGLSSDETGFSNGNFHCDAIHLGQVVFNRIVIELNKVE